MAASIQADLPQDASEPIRLEALQRYLFTDQGFHGSRTDYYHRANSYLNRVIDDREGLPISLSVLTIVLGRRLDLHLDGVGLPGHFVVRHEPREGEVQLIDAFDRGRILSREEAATRVMATLGRPLRDEDLLASDPRAIVRRMLGNLLGIAQQSRDATAMLRYLDAIVAIDPTTARERAMRAALRWEAGNVAAALADLDWLVEHEPPDLDLDAIRQMRERLRAAE
jgi:regulator of sirC expression with transglutaminase-like and TPR domain